jgi:hypothetical protein
LLLQFTRIFWEELRPQCEADSSTPKQALLALLEPFCMIAEVSSQESLVRHVHEHIFRKAPRELFTALMQQILASAAKPGTTQKNRQALYDTADTLERLAALPAPKDIKPLRLRDGADSSANTSSLPLLELPPSVQPVEQVPKEAASGEKFYKKRGKKRKASKSGGSDEKSAKSTPGMSPLVLPEAMIPVDESSSSKPLGKKGKKKLKAKTTPAASDANPKRRKGKKKNTKL